MAPTRRPCAGPSSEYWGRNMSISSTSRHPRWTYLLPHLIERAVELDADHVALRHREDTLTYGQLFSRSMQLAHTLVADGVKPGERIGILLRKGIDSAVALYGIMSAGAVYVPIDPTAPASRIAFLVRDCGITRLVTNDAMVPALQALVDRGVSLAAVYGVSDHAASPFSSVAWEGMTGFPEGSPNVSVTEQDLCYILYTSGSTGTPKGIMHTHRSALSWAEIAASVYQLEPDDVISNYAPLHFDLSTLDYFGGARAGATTVIIPEEYTRFPASLAKLVAKERLTVFYTVPFALVQLSAPGILDGLDLGELRLVLFGGEPMPIKHLREVMGKVPHAQFVNVYGPTETNGCTDYPIERPLADDLHSLPIGRPYPNVEILVLDDGGRSVGVGDAGELLVRTPTLMRGYWGRRDLNDQAFHETTERGGLPDVYHRTGDLVSPMDDGNLRFLGRRDRQIKSRGNRVELDEVETALLSNADVHEAAVYAVPDDAGILEIRAEVILTPTSKSEEKDLIDNLRSVLPTYAVPVSITVRSSFPRTSTGKIDRRAMQAEPRPTIGASGLR